MFVLTLGKSGLKRLGAVAVAGVALAGAVFAAGSFWKGDTASPTAAQPEAETKTEAEQAGPNPAEMKIENTEGLDQFFKAYGLEMDLADTLVDKVKIPRKWDESFSAFNTVVKESGLDLEKYKGRTVEKWMVFCPGKSTGDQKTYGVVLVYKQQPVGAYLVYKPSGEVTGLAPAAQTAAPLTEQEAQETSAEFGSDAQVVGTTEQPASAEPAEEDAAVLAELETMLAAAGAEPVE